jgi:16S rRNA (guanine966-N2)-methyltransferase
VIRIVAGELRGRRLTVGPGVRPTTERAREALFSILGERVRDARALDAAAGSGAVGFEALSRGAREVVFVEADRCIARVLEANAVATGMEKRTVIHVRTVATFLRVDRPAPFDVVFFDPPWADPVVDEMEGLWRVLAAGGTFVVERGSETDPWPSAPVDPDVRRYGTTSLFLYGKPSAPEAGPDAGGNAPGRGENPEEASRGPFRGIDRAATRQ